MVMTQSALLFMGVLATLATVGLFQNFGDEATRAVVGFAGSIVWFGVGISAFDVVIEETGSPPMQEPIMPLVFLGFGFGAVVALFSLNVLVQALRSSTDVSDADLEL